ncbi:hypothetical protein LAZ67_1006240 [Cordylochernes scorpioides]|uniref:Transposase Tc1-like domain-containing protein n=1 Tax=Cordylochernes scorpioides TaxID=51811 RepID=A0ABY6JYJ0_9ARAC|nr:hypothetical protein LAZ67_1006240 [Cordylochernes scorpioides]
MTDRSVTSRTVEQHIQSVTHHPVSARTIRRHLQQSGLSARRPLPSILLAQNYRRLPLQWCDERRIWTAVWNEIVFTDESRFALQRQDRRIRVLSHRGERMLNNCVMHRHRALHRVLCLLSGENSDSVHFLRNIRKYNSCFQMTSFGAENQTHSVTFPTTFSIQGQVYHRIGSLMPSENQPSRFLQIYFMGNDGDDDDIQTDRRCQQIQGVRRNIVQGLQRHVAPTQSTGIILAYRDYGSSYYSIYFLIGRDFIVIRILNRRI